jgi:hypothetical protein
MKKKLIVFFVFVSICTSALPISASLGTINEWKKPSLNYDSGDIEILSNDLVRYIGPRDPLMGNPKGPGPGYYDTSEYLIGSVGVGLIFLESNGAIDPSTENWTPTEVSNVLSEINQSLTWWSNQNPYASVSYTLDIHTAVPTSYEPINHPSVFTDPSWEKLWVSEAMAYLGYTSGDWMKRTRDYINAMRTAKGSDWAYTVFLIDSSNDVDGNFSDGYSAYGYMGGPFLVMTYDNGAWGISRMDQVMAHETGHIFWATDEYNGITEYSGYLNAADVEGSGCLMNNNNLALSSGTKLQVGWRDTDADNILDIIDTNPDTILNPYPQDPTPLQTLVYTGSATEVPYPNNNPQPSNAGNDVTVNKIMIVLYRIDGGMWTAATPSDGLFNQPMELYTFTTIPLPHGPHLIETFATNNVGNLDSSLASDTVTIDNPPAIPTLTGTVDGNINQPYMYNCSAADMDGDSVFYWIDWDDGTNTGWLGPFPPGTLIHVNHTWTVKGTYQVQAKAKDIYNMEGNWATLDVTMPLITIFDNSFFTEFLQRHPLLSYLLSLLTDGITVRTY